MSRNKTNFNFLAVVFSAIVQLAILNFSIANSIEGGN